MYLATFRSAGWSCERLLSICARNTVSNVITFHVFEACNKISYLCNKYYTRIINILLVGQFFVMILVLIFDEVILRTYKKAFSRVSMGAAYVIRKKRYQEIKSLRETIGGEQNDTKVSKIQKAREAWTDKPRVLHASVAATTCISEGLL
jgi:hypothetical protein